MAAGGTGTVNTRPDWPAEAIAAAIAMLAAITLMVGYSLWLHARQAPPDYTTWCTQHPTAEACR